MFALLGSFKVGYPTPILTTNTSSQYVPVYLSLSIRITHRSFVAVVDLWAVTLCVERV
jgi:hypothetical protein